MVVLLSNPPHTEILTRRIKETSPTQKFTGYFEYSESSTLYEKVPFTSQFAAAKWFEKKFVNRYGKPFKARAPQAYDIIKLIALTHKNTAAKLTGKQIVEKLSAIQDIPGASGTLNISGTRTIENECVFKTFKNGKLVIIQESDIALGK